MNQQETNKRLKDLMNSRTSEMEIQSLKKTIVEKDKRILELESEVRVMMKMLKIK